MNNVPVDRVCTQQVSLQVGDAQSQIRANKGCLVESCRCAEYFIPTLYGNGFIHIPAIGNKGLIRNILFKTYTPVADQPGEGSWGPVSLLLDQFETAAPPSLS